MDGLLKAGLESILKVEIIQVIQNQQLNASISSSENNNNNNGSLINYYDYSQLIHGVKNEVDQSSGAFSEGCGTNVLNIMIRNLYGKVYQIQIDSSSTIMDLKKLLKINYEKEIDLNKMLLVYGSKILDNNKTIDDYSIRNQSTINLLISNSKVNLYNVFDHGYDYNFENIIDAPNSYYRGGVVYNRPCGSRRYALFVLGRFSDGNNWLGMSNSSWPVSYHSSLSYPDIKNSILSIYPNINLVPNQEVLTTPSFELAKKSAHTFIFNGIKYYIVFQNRVNPNSITKINVANGEYWKTLPDFNHLRPYSICIGRI